MKIAVIGYSGALWKGRRTQKEKWLAAGLEKYPEKVMVLKSQKDIDRYLEGLSC